MLKLYFIREEMDYPLLTFFCCR